MIYMRQKICLIFFMAVFLSFFSGISFSGISFSEISNAASLPSMPVHVQRTLYNAQEAFKNGNNSKAFEIIEKHIKNDKENPHPLIYCALGNYQYADKNIKSAYKAYKKGFELDPKSVDLCINSGKTAYDLKKYNEAARLFERAYKLNNDPEFLYQAGAAWYKGKSFKRAKSVLKKMIKKNKKTANSRLLLLVHVLLELKHEKEAARLLDTCLDRRPESVQYWRVLARIRLDSKDYKRGAAALEIAYKLKKPTIKELEDLADIYLYTNLPVKALRILENAYGSKPAPVQCEKLADVAASAQRFKEAVRYLDIAIKKSPKPEYHIKKGKLYYERGLWNKALKSFDAGIKMDEKQDIARLLSGYCLLESGNYDSARKAFTDVPENSPHKKEAMDGLKFLIEYDLYN